MDKLNEAMTTEEAARLLGYHINHVRRLIREGVLEAEKIGRVWFIDRDSVYRIRAQQGEGGRLPK